MEKLLKENETAELLGLAMATLRRWRWAGRGPAFVKMGHAVRYEPSELRRFIEEGRQQSTSSGFEPRRSGDLSVGDPK